MKKFLMMVALMLGMSTATFASEDFIGIFNDKPTINTLKINEGSQRDYSFDINHDKLAEYLNLDEDDKDMLRYIHGAFCNGMKLAAEAETEESRNKLICNSINYEITNMQSILSEEQYLKFLRVFNVSLVNKGFGDIIRNHEFVVEK